IFFKVLLCLLLFCCLSNAYLHQLTDHLISLCTKLRSTIFGSKIIGGKDVTINDFNWMAAVVLHSSPKTIRCGAVFLKGNWLLSAAHCFPRSKNAYKVRIGVRRLHDNSLKEDEYNISSIVFHPQYNRKEQGNDLALIKTDRPIRMYNLVGPVPGVDDGSYEWNSGSPCYVAGWGNTQETGEFTGYFG
uniref:Peptidase S1 domain-containing protein n=1 Tax=Scleropages formosus TaxID=113540 RepID=A0A8C9SV50_SCLFO